MKRLEVNYSLKSMDVLVSFARYNFVTRTLNNSNLKVLDYGCGSGYGTKILMEKFKDVTAFDVYPDGYKPEGINVIQDIGEIRKKKYDVITCFEVIEHLNEKDQIKLMEELVNLLNENGVLYISTVRKLDPPPTENRKKEHIKELTFEEFLDICQRFFNNVFTFGQIDQIISTFYKENHYHFVFICTYKKKI
jgi:2-polyprenyl-3-methyl-5-hydroxy-6-metoxy-1,4-benzoquinol methylase